MADTQIIIEKTLEDYFTDWENHVFGFGYGTGEAYTIQALKAFFDHFTPENKAYDYRELEADLGNVVAWMMINVMGHADVIEYGSSPRFAWLTPKGMALRNFIATKTAGELVELTARDENYIICSPDACNCGERGHVEGRICPNPFLHDKFADAAS